MKRYIRSSKYSFIDILNDPRGRELVDAIENDEEEIKGRGIDLDDESEFYVRHRLRAISDLKKEFGFEWR